MAHNAMNSRVDSEVVRGPVVGHRQQDRSGRVIDGPVDEAVGSRLDELEETLAANASVKTISTSVQFSSAHTMSAVRLRLDEVFDLVKHDLALVECVVS
jgi:hypothetical protein